MSAVLIHSALVKKATKWVVLVIAFAGYVFAVAILLRLTIGSAPREEDVSQIEVVHEQPPVVRKNEEQIGVPVLLKIPKINVNAKIASAGLTSDGAMDIKKNPLDVAWYKFGARPGERGSAVIAGHYGWENGEGSVFNELHTLKPGAQILVEDTSGVDVSFIVRESRNYNPDADASTVFKSSDGKQHLNLITCEGVWQSDKQTYSSRLVVFADREVK